EDARITEERRDVAEQHAWPGVVRDRADGVLNLLQSARVHSRHYIARLLEILDVEVALLVGPGLPGSPPRGLRLGREGVRGVFVAVLGDQALAGLEADDFSGDRHCLRSPADEVHLDTARSRHPHGFVAEAL